MFDLLTEALKALSAYPIIQGAVALLVLLVGIHVMRRGEKDRKSNAINGNGMPIPQWVVIGPVSDAIGAIHELAEQSRKGNDLLERAIDELQAARIALELIRNESRLR